MQQLLAEVGLRSDELKGQTAVVTGAGRGIGRMAALALGLIGARVLAAELSDEGQETEHLIRQAGGESLFVRTDVSAEADVARLAEAAGPAALLINNAILCPVASVNEMDVALFDRVVAVNLRGAFLTVKAFLPGMRALGRGVVINLVSTEAMPGLSAYMATKQGLTGFTQSLAAEVGGEGIRAIALSPGMVDTPGLRTAGAGLAPLLGMQAEQFFGLSLHPAYPGLMPVEHAGLAVAYLAARLAAECHGEVVTGYTVLERAGLLKPAPAPAAAAMTPATARPMDATREGALRLCGRLEAILAETAADFERLPIFIRPLARSGFKGKAGQSLQDWQRTASGLRTAVELGQPVDAPRLQGLLEKLIGYVQGVPAETARFTKDQALLAQVSERMVSYEADLRALAAVIRQM